MGKKYTRAQFIRSGGRLHIRPKVEFIGGLEPVEKKPSKHKRKKENRDAKDTLCQEGA